MPSAQVEAAPEPAAAAEAKPETQVEVAQEVAQEQPPAAEDAPLNPAPAASKSRASKPLDVADLMCSCKCQLLPADRPKVIAEFVGMALFVYTGVGTAHMAVRNNPFGVMGSLLCISLAFGLGITAFVYMTAGISGGHLNPAVTTSLCLLGEIKGSLAAWYVLAQCLGATLGALLAAAADPYSMAFAVNVVSRYGCGGHGLTAVDLQECQNDNWPMVNTTATVRDGTIAEFMWGQAFVVEFVGTFMLVIVVLLTAVNKKSIAGNLAPVPIGLAVFFAHLTAIPVTNCSINPARSLGAVLAASFMPFHQLAADGTNETHERVDLAWNHIFFFWGVPILGGWAAVELYKFCFKEGGFLDQAATAAAAAPKDPVAAIEGPPTVTVVSSASPPDNDEGGTKDAPQGAADTPAAENATEGKTPVAVDENKTEGKSAV